jgi:hypothetical protein
MGWGGWCNRSWLLMSVETSSSEWVVVQMVAGFVPALALQAPTPAFTLLYFSSHSYPHSPSSQGSLGERLRGGRNLERTAGSCFCRGFPMIGRCNVDCVVADCVRKEVMKQSAMMFVLMKKYLVGSWVMVGRMTDQAMVEDFY